MDLSFEKNASYEWFRNFWRDSFITSDGEHSGCTIEATTPEIIDKIHEIDTVGGFSSGSLHNIVEYNPKRIKILHINIIRRDRAA